MDQWGIQSQSVNAMTVFDDGNGPALYVGGSFPAAGGVEVNNIAKWDGDTWSSVGGGVSSVQGFSSQISAMAVFDDGSGPALYVGGLFNTAGSVEAFSIAKWNGQEWSTVGDGVNNTVVTLKVFDDGSGSGPALYAGGLFTTAGGVDVNRIAKWDGQQWSPVGDGMNSTVLTLMIFDDGSGPALIAGGTFTAAGGVEANRIAKWDGQEWSPVGGGLDDTVWDLVVFDDGRGPALYAGGSFTTAGSTESSKIAKWDGQAWSSVGGGVDATVRNLTVFDDGSGPVLYVGGWFSAAGEVSANRIAKWDGSRWSSLGSGVNNPVLALGVFDYGNGQDLYVGGLFTTAGGETVNRIAKWDSQEWTPLGGNGLSSTVRALTVFDDGSGPALYAGGSFTSVGGIDVNRIAKWDGNEWSSLGSGIIGFVYALAVFDDGSGSALYAGGNFSIAGGVGVNSIAKWDGNEWSPLGGEISISLVRAFAVFDDGSGPALYAAGLISSVGGMQSSGIAKWNGEEWSPLGSGVGGLINALTIFDDGSGAALYAGGQFAAAGGMSANHIAKWDGGSWSALGSGMAGGSFPTGVYALTVFDDGSGDGPALYAGGRFTTAGGVDASRIAKWDGSSWLALGTGMNSQVNALTVFDDGSGGGPALYAGGDFTAAGAVAANRIAKWDGSEWSALGSGINGESYEVRTLKGVEADSGGSPALYVGGDFTISPAGDSYLAKWQGCPVDTEPTIPGDLNDDGIVNVFDLLILLENWGVCANATDCPADLNDDGVVNVLDLLILLENWG